MNDYEKVKSLFPDPTPCGVWLELQNGFQGLVTDRGAYRLRRKVNLGAGLIRFEIFTLTRKVGLKSQGYMQL